MTTFEDREAAFEAKYKLDQDFVFKMNIRAVKSFGFWAADQLGMTGDDAECYANAVVDADFEEPGFEDVFRKVNGDFEAKGVNVPDEKVRTVFDEKLSEVKLEMVAEREA